MCHKRPIADVAFECEVYRAVLKSQFDAEFGRSRPANYIRRVRRDAKGIQQVDSGISVQVLANPPTRQQLAALLGISDPRLLIGYERLSVKSIREFGRLIGSECWVSITPSVTSEHHAEIFGFPNPLADRHRAESIAEQFLDRLGLATTMF